MTEKITISISASQTHGDSLLVGDAVKQIGDFFALLDSFGGQKENIDWKIVSAKMESPLEMVEEPCSDSITNPEMLELIAREQKKAIEKDVIALSTGRIPAALALKGSSAIVKRMLKRNMNGIGRTTIKLWEGKPALEFTPQVAERIMEAYRKIEEVPELLPDDMTRTELGSVDGYLLQVGEAWNKPAIQIQDRVTDGIIWCVVSQETKDAFNSCAHLLDIWNHRRVLVSGVIRYGQEGQIYRMDANKAELIEAREVSLDEIKDTSFTGGLTPAEYIDRLREDPLG